MSKCCKSGFQWEGKPEGKETKIAGLDTYVAGEKSDHAILIVHDVFGWTLPNLRLLADHFAKEVGATVYLPDFFDGEVVSPETLEDPAKREKFDLMAFIGRNGKDKRFPSMEAVCKELRQSHKKIGAIGYCYGGWAVFQLGAKGKNLVDSISTAHPSLLTKEEIDAVGVPTQILAPETDQMFTPELKAYANEKIPSLNIIYDYQYYPGLVHGFAARGDQSKPEQKAGLERAKNDAVHWFTQTLL